MKVGADPEFELRDEDGDLVYASNHIRDSACDERLGLDGHQATGELRPRPGHAQDVFEEIDSLLTDLADILAGKDIKVYAGSGKELALGGHIHFSGVNSSLALVEALYRCITKPLNSISETYYRQHQGYGGADDQTRGQPHGWEYRRPLSWIVTPKLTLGVLTVAEVLARAEQAHKIERIENVEDLLTHANSTEEIAIREFYKEIDSLKSKNLEEIEVLAAWKKDQTSRQPVSFNHNDFGLTQIEALCKKKRFETMNIQVCGLARERTEEKQIWLSLGIMRIIRKRKAWRSYIKVWPDEPDYKIGISHSHRQFKYFKLAARRMDYILKVLKREEEESKRET